MALLKSDTSVVVAITVIQTALRLVGSIILTRVLNAEAFGIVGLISSVGTIFNLVSDIGIGAYIIREKGSLTREFLDEVWTIRLARSGALTVAAAILAAPIANQLGKPEMVGPLLFGALFFVIDGCTSLSFATALRDGLLRRVQFLGLIAAAISLVASITLALIFKSYWSILINNTLTQVLVLFFSYRYFPNSRRRWRVSIDRWRVMWRFARYITASTIITLIITQFDKVLFGKLFSLHEFGLYILAGNIAAIASSLALSWAGSVFYPRIAKLAHEATTNLQSAYYRERMPFAVLYSLAIGGLIGAAPLAVSILYDARYADSAIYLQALAFSALFVLDNQTYNDLMIALDRSAFTLQTNLVRIGHLALGVVPAYLFYGAWGVLMIIVTVETTAKLFGMLILQRQSLMRFGWEAFAVLVALLGYGLGTVINFAGLSVLH